MDNILQYFRTVYAPESFLYLLICIALWNVLNRLNIRIQNPYYDQELEIIHLVSAIVGGLLREWKIMEGIAFTAEKVARRLTVRNTDPISRKSETSDKAETNAQEIPTAIEASPEAPNEVEEPADDKGDDSNKAPIPRLLIEHVQDGSDELQVVRAVDADSDDESDKELEDSPKPLLQVQRVQHGPNEMQAVSTPDNSANGMKQFPLPETPSPKTPLKKMQRSSSPRVRLELEEMLNMQPCVRLELDELGNSANIQTPYRQDDPAIKKCENMTPIDLGSVSGDSTVQYKE